MLDTVCWSSSLSERAKKTAWDFSDEAHPTSPSKLFDGDAKQQIEALRDYLWHLELNNAKPAKTASVAPHRG